MDPQGSLRAMQDTLHQGPFPEQQVPIPEQREPVAEPLGEAQQERLTTIPEGDADRSEADSSAPRADAGQIVIFKEKPIDLDDGSEASGEEGSSAPAQSAVPEGSGVQRGPEVQQGSPSEYSDSQCQDQTPAGIPAAATTFLSFRIAPTSLPALTTVHRTHPETFANFRAQSALGGGMILNNLATVIDSLHNIPLKKFGDSSLKDAKEGLVDLQTMSGLEVGWLVAHLERMHSARRALKLSFWAESKQREVERAREKVDLTRAALAQREEELREREVELQAALRERSDFEAAGGEIFEKDVPVTRGLFPRPPP